MIVTTGESGLLSQTKITYSDFLKRLKISTHDYIVLKSSFILSQIYVANLYEINKYGLNVVFI